MLKGLDPLLDAELFYLLAAMGHGDDLALVDRNFPADSVARTTVTGRLVRQAEGRELTMAAPERFAFYEAAKGAYAVVATAEARPYGCFILKQGVVLD